MLDLLTKFFMFVMYVVVFKLLLDMSNEGFMNLVKFVIACKIVNFGISFVSWKRKEK